MLRFNDIVSGRHNAFEPKFSHFIITLIIFMAIYFTAFEYRHALPWYLVLPLLIGCVISSIGLVVSFGSLRHSKMVVVQAIVFGFIAWKIPYEMMMKLIYGVGAFAAVYFFIKSLCLRYLKLRNIWETCTGIVAFCVLYPYTIRTLENLLH